jgi:chemotaxis protein methyltransferase CheR
MFDPEADALLAWALPQRGLRWHGFRRNRRQVYRRLHARIHSLGLETTAAYRAYLENHAEEWPQLDQLCRVTISRFARDGAIWATLVDEVLPSLESSGTVRAWSAGCGAGEEPYTLAIAWLVGVASASPLEILATDIDDVQLARATAGCFPSGALRELPEAWRRAAFDDQLCVRAQFRAPIRFAHHDLRTPPPEPGPFDLVLCRNLAFSYFDEPTQRAVASSFRAVMRTGGVLIVGLDESLPSGTPGFALQSPCIYVAEPALDGAP